MEKLLLSLLVIVFLFIHNHIVIINGQEIISDDENICISSTNTYTVKVNIFASELGMLFEKYFRIY